MTVIEGIPGGTFVLEVVAAWTVIAGAAGYWWEKRDPNFDVTRAVAYQSFWSMVFATGLQLIFLVTR